MSTRQDIFDAVRHYLTERLGEDEAKMIAIERMRGQECRAAIEWAMRGTEEDRPAMPRWAEDEVPPSPGLRTGDFAFVRRFVPAERELPPKIPGTDEALAIVTARKMLARAERDAAIAAAQREHERETERLARERVEEEVRAGERVR